MQTAAVPVPVGFLVGVDVAVGVVVVAVGDALGVTVVAIGVGVVVGVDVGSNTTKDGYEISSPELGPGVRNVYIHAMGVRISSDTGGSRLGS